MVKFVTKRILDLMDAKLNFLQISEICTANWFCIHVIFFVQI